MERLINLDPQQIHDTLLLALSVFILFTFLSYLLFNPVRKMLETRKEKIAKDIADAEYEKDSALKMRDEYVEKMQVADKEAEGILSEARTKAMHNEAKIVNEAKEEAARIIARAQEEAVLEKKRALDDMKQEMVSIASLMAGKVVSQNIDTKVQDSLVDETLKEIGESTWLS